MNVREGKFNIVKIAVVGGILLACIYTANSFISGNTKNFLFAIGFLVLPLSFIYWKQTLLIIPIWILVEGLVRKTLLDSVVVVFAKDAALLLVYFRVFLNHLSSRQPLLVKTDLSRPLLILLAWYILELANPNLPSVWVGVVGIKVMFYYIPYFYLTRLLFPTKESLFRYVKLLLILTIPVCGLAYYQFLTGTDTTAVKTTTFFLTSEGGRVLRPSASFYYNSNFGQYVFFMFLVTLSVLNVRFFNKNRVLLFFIFICNLVGLMVSGQRSAWATIVAQFALMFILSPVIPKKYSMIPRIAFFALISIAIITALMPKTYETFQARIEATMDDPEVSGYVFTYRMEQVSVNHILQNHPIIGQGPGTNTPAARHVVANIDDTIESMGGTEGGYVQAWWEIGIFGLLMFLWVIFSLLKYSLKTSRQLKDQELKQFAIVGTLICSGYMLANITGGLLNTMSTAILFWFFMGIMPTINELDGKIISSETEKKAG